MGLEQSGYRPLDKQAGALGLSRSTTWAILQVSYKASGVSGSIIKKMLQSPELPPPVRQWIDQYVSEKLSGAYRHGTKRLRNFKAQVAI
jgi:cobyric acid synthase